MNIWKTVFVINALIFLLCLMAVVYKSGRISMPKTGGMVDWWRNNEKNLIPAFQLIGFISVLLLLANWLCARFGWKWWWVMWESGPFATVQISILAAIFAVRSSGSDKVVKTAAICLLVIVGVGWVSMYKDDRSHPNITSTEIRKVQKVYFVKSGEWSAPRLSDDLVTVDDMPSIEAEITFANGEVVKRHFDGMKISVPLGTMVRFRSDRDFSLTVLEADG